MEYMWPSAAIFVCLIFTGPGGHGPRSETLAKVLMLCY